MCVGTLGVLGNYTMQSKGEVLCECEDHATITGINTVTQ